MKIGNVQLDNPFIAAPMAGVSDASMRMLCREMGASFVCTEMISAKGLLFGNKKTEELMVSDPKGLPVSYQLFGSEPVIMAKAAEQLSERENAFLDINMGCPVPKVVKNGEGSALLKDPNRLHDVAEAVVSAAGKPVTAKIRTGWDENTIVAVEAAMALEAAGVAAIAVHGRTRQQFYSGKADWQQIAKVKKAVSIPVIGNGDVFTATDGMAMMEQTGCDFVMVARGMLGNPWIFRELVSLWKGESLPPRPSLREKGALMIRHYNLVVAEKTERVAVREMRKHTGWYFKGEHGATEIRRAINRIQDGEALKRCIIDYCGLVDIV